MVMLCAWDSEKEANIVNKSLVFFGETVNNETLLPLLSLLGALSLKILFFGLRVNLQRSCLRIV